MGTQSRIANSLMKNFMLNEPDAYSMTKLIEAFQLGDEIDDALFALEENGDLTQTLADLNGVRMKLDTAIDDLAAAFSRLQPRKNARDNG
jgi:hypothetical protein